MTTQNTPNLTTTQVYRPISTLQAAHEQAMRDLTAAVAAHDEVRMKQAFDQITWIEQRQREAASKIFQHYVQKARARLQA